MSGVEIFFMVTKENIIEEWYEFIKYMLPVIQKFPREQKFLIGDRIQNKLLDIQEIFIEAYYTERNQKQELLKKVNIWLEQLRYFNRLCYESGYYTSKKYKYIAEWLNNTGKKNGGWLKSLK